MSTGILYIISTPIGNLTDITIRALEVLKNVELILSEDTRETSKMLDKFQISTPQISYRDQNHSKIYAKIRDLLQNGHNLGLVSDSGTPLISDPGFKLVRDLIEENVKIEVIPGPTAVTSALVISGLPTDKFAFLGFLPKTSGARQRLLKQYGETEATLIIYESPFRVVKLLEEIKVTLGNRNVSVVKDLTKMFEEVHRGKLEEVLEIFKKKTIKGEYIVLIAKEDL